MAISLLGTPRFQYGGVALRLAFAKSTLAVLAYVLLNRTTPQRRDDVAFALWPDDLESNARANLRRHVYLITRALPHVAEPWIVADTRSIGWNERAPLHFDVELFERYAADPTAREHAIDLYTGDLLADLEAEWLDGRRQYFRDRFCDVALAAARAAASAGDFARAIELAQRVVACDPWREEAIRTIVAGRSGAGDRASAISAYRDFERRLREELDAEPMAETRALYESIAGGPPLAAPAPTLAPRARTVPTHLSRFIGREREVATVAGALESCRLVTLIGAAGVGKSRLATQVAEESSVRSTFADEPMFIELAAVANDRAAFETKIRDAFAIDPSDESVVDAVARVAGSRRFLVILDNAEHLVDCAGPFLLELYARSDNVTILTTSRQPFHIAGEQIVGLRPLALPEGESDLAEALGSEAVALFLDRAKSLDADFAASPDDARHIVRICRQLDGIPLAIELAAARSNILTPKEIDDRLADRFTLLKTRRVDTLRHHQTLRATLDWSFDLLLERERLTFCRLAVFKNGWTLASAIGVATLDGTDDVDVFESLTRLIDQSLVVVHDSDGRRRYDFLDTVRAYALLRLAESGEEDAAREAVSVHFERFVGEKRAQFGSSDEKIAFDAVALEHDNIVGIIDGAMARGDATRAARLSIWLAPFWVTRGFAVEARHRVETLLQMEDGFDRSLQRELSNVASILHFRCGDVARSLEWASRALGAEAQGAEDRMTADALVGQARCWFSGNDFAAATTALQRALRTYERLDDRLEIARALNFLGLIADGRAARDLHERSLSIYEERGYSHGVATVNYHLGYQAYERGEHAQSIAYTTKARDIWHDSGNLQAENWAHYNIACAELALGSTEAATLRFHSCVRTAARYGFGKDLADGLERLAGIVAAYEPELGARCMGHASRMRSRFGHAMPENERTGYEADVARVASLLGSTAFARAWQDGRDAVGERVIEAIGDAISRRYRDRS